jgi:hypothetical protein
MTVYIPTIGRIGNVRAIVPRWLEQDLPVCIVVRPWEYRKHLALRDQEGWDRKHVRVRMLPENTPPGYGATRNFIVGYARSRYEESVIISDDDMQPSRNTQPFRLLLDEAAKPRVLGIGAVRSIHDRFTGGAVSRLHGPILCPGGWGFQCFAINVRLAKRLGNFDPLLHAHGDDAELARQGIAHGFPWRVHTDVWAESIGKRYAAGGLSAVYRSPEARAEAERACMARINSRWPEYTNRPDQRVRTAWQKMLDDYIPDWRKLSAIHGGALED